MSSTTSSSTTTSLALRELTLRQLEQTNDSLKFQLASLQTRYDAVLTSEERLAKRLEESEREMVWMRQQMEEAKRAEEKALRKMVDDMNEERALARQALVESEERVAAARRDVATLDDLLREMRERGGKGETSTTTTSSTAASKRLKRETPANDENDEDPESRERQRLELNELRRKVRELSAENEALQRGVAVSGRAQELAAQLTLAQRNERALEEELRRIRRDHKETIPELKSHLTVANAKIELLRQAEKERDVWAKEIEEWKEVFRFAVVGGGNVIRGGGVIVKDENAVETQSQQTTSPARRVVEMIMRLQKECLESEMRCGQAESERAVFESRLKSANERIHVMNAEMTALKESEKKASEGNDELVRRLKRTELERDAAERIVTNWSSTTVDNLVDHRVALIGDSMRELRRELDAEKRINDELRNALKEASESATASTTTTTRVLHLRPDVKSGLLTSGSSSSTSATNPHVIPFTPRQPTSSSSFSTAAASQPPAMADSVPRGGGAPPGTVDVDKRRERLKELFQKQILLFKEAVYLLLGFKIDMTPDARPQVRVRSAFAESPDDYLLFRFHPETSAMELLETNYQSTLSPEQLTYLTKCHSVPAFLASLTLMLFEKQTFAF